MLECIGKAFSRWSVIVGAVQFIILTILGLCSAPSWAIIIVGLFLCAVAIAAAHFKQKNVATYDPRKEDVYDPRYFRIVPIEGAVHGDN